MTNELSTERAIEALYTVRAYYASLTAGYPKGKDCKGIGDVMCSEIANSCLMAIQALEQQQSEDCISRQAVLNGLASIAKNKAKSDAQKSLMGRVMFFTEHLPSVTPRTNLAETSQDCISRQAALDTIGNVPDYDDGMVWEALSHAQRDVALLPPVTPQQTRWIPVSERLPKENEYIGDVCKYYLVQDEYGDLHVAHLSNVGWIPMDSLKAIGDEVIAWMPLPEPYKEDSE